MFRLNWKHNKYRDMVFWQFQELFHDIWLPYYSHWIHCNKHHQHINYVYSTILSHRSFMSWTFSFTIFTFCTYYTLTLTLTLLIKHHPWIKSCTDWIVIWTLQLCMHAHQFNPQLRCFKVHNVPCLILLWVWISKSYSKTPKKWENIDKKCPEIETGQRSNHRQSAGNL